MTNEEAKNELVLWRNRNSDNGYHKKFVDALTVAIKALEREPCDDYISRKALTDTTICEGISCNECSFNTCEDGQSGCLLKERVDKLPSVTPQPKMGKWIIKSDSEEFAKWTECSECGYKHNCITYEDKFCPNCGAKMEASE